MSSSALGFGQPEVGTNSSVLFRLVRPECPNKFQATIKREAVFKFWRMLTYAILSRALQAIEVRRMGLLSFVFEISCFTIEGRMKYRCLKHTC